VKLGQLMQAHQSELVVTPRHEAWLAKNANASYSDEAKEFMAGEIGKPQRDRTKTFSASGAGVCPRRRQFEYLGITEGKRPIKTSLAQIFHNGTFMHLRWQMAGLTDGWMVKAEVPVVNPDLMLSGTLDGLSYKGTGIELKSINSNGFRNIMQHGPKRLHVYQTASYTLSGAPNEFSIIYECKDTQEYKEFIHTIKPEALEMVRHEQEVLAHKTGMKELFPMKDECWAKQGTEYIQCPFRDICHKQRDWETAEQWDSTCASSGRVLRLRPTSSLPPG